MAQNVFVITDYSGVDPEIFGNIDNGFYQRPKIYSLGLNFNF
jgi:iron complex outermembrane receptor protein